MKVYHILNSCQVKVFLFYIFYMVREQAGRKLPIQHVSYQQPRGCKNCKSGFICPTQPAFTRRPWRGNASPVLPCTCAAVYLLQFQQPLSSFVQTHWMGNFSVSPAPSHCDNNIQGYFMFFEYFVLYFSNVLFYFFRIIKRAGQVFLPILLLFT